MEPIETTISLSKELILSIRKKAKKEKMIFAQMIQQLYVFGPNHCMVLYYENGDHFRKENGKKIKVGNDEIKLFDVLNPDGKMIFVRRASSPPIEDRI